jgi:hypothetical protein
MKKKKRVERCVWSRVFRKLGDILLRQLNHTSTVNLLELIKGILDQYFSSLLFDDAYFVHLSQYFHKPQLKLDTARDLYDGDGT